MTIRDETAKAPGEVRGSTNKSSHACGRRRDGEPAVFWRVESREAEADLKQYVEVERDEPARRHAQKAHDGLSQRRIGGCSRSVHE